LAIDLALGFPTGPFSVGLAFSFSSDKLAASSLQKVDPSSRTTDEDSKGGSKEKPRHCQSRQGDLKPPFSLFTLSLLLRLASEI
jgi:hypothetical protein